MYSTEKMLWETTDKSPIMFCMTVCTNFYPRNSVVCQSPQIVGVIHIHMSLESFWIFLPSWWSWQGHTQIYNSGFKIPTVSQICLIQGRFFHAEGGSSIQRLDERTSTSPCWPFKPAGLSSGWVCDNEFREIICWNTFYFLSNSDMFPVHSWIEHWLQVAHFSHEFNRLYF